MLINRFKGKSENQDMAVPYEQTQEPCGKINVFPKNLKKKKVFNSSLPKVKD